jgi:hypothetical protein
MDETPVRLDGIIQDANIHHKSTDGTKTEYTGNSRLLNPNYDQSVFNEAFSSVNTPKFQDEPEMISSQAVGTPF